MYHGVPREVLTSAGQCVSAKLGSICPSEYPGRCVLAYQCLDDRFWSGSEPGSKGKYLSKVGQITESADLHVFGMHERPPGLIGSPLVEPWDSLQEGRAPA